MTDVRVGRTITSGTFSLDGQTFDVDNNVWVVGDDAECVVLDAPHSVPKIEKVIKGRRVLAILCTHAHDDHVRVAPELAARVDAPILLHPDDAPVWALTHPTVKPDAPLSAGMRIVVGDIGLTVLHTPGHSPGSVCFYSSELGMVFTGDTLFEGGPGATGRSFSNHDVIVHSVVTKLFTLPPDTIVHTGHGSSTSVGAERDREADWNHGDAGG